MLNDSGDREKFESGAVRDMKKGKGRCDLLPLDVIWKLSKKYDFFSDNIHLEKDKKIFTESMLYFINNFQKYKDIDALYSCLYNAVQRGMFKSFTDMILELSKHFEEGAEKYGEYNWQKGIPEWSYIDSAIRHLLKWARGDEDERHDRAFVWNIICLIWTIENKGDNDDINNFYCTN